MISPIAHLPAEPFFMQAVPGERFCITHPSRLKDECLGAVIYIHPFAEEMNKSRRMIALQSKILADLGYTVLQLDLYGCGDSSGDFADARWAIWKSDLATAEKWLAERYAGPITIWGLRLGALLALEFASMTSSKIQQLILWQPIINPENFVTQFLRLRLASEILLEGGRQNSATQALRNELASGQLVEIAGYELAPELANDISSINVARLAVTKCPVHWFEIVPESRLSLTPAGESLASSWRQQGVNLVVHPVPGLTFWATQEITICAELLSAMKRLFSLSKP